jgi:UDP-N-acetylglucosamine 4,6-dehydratase/5-epimerase
MFKGKTLLITGGTGTFGNAVLKRFLTTGISEIRVLSRDEKKQEDMRLAYANPKLRFYIGDVRDYVSVASAMVGVDYVFHAAALKQVPSCEFYPLEAIRTNALGAENVMSAAMDSGVERVITLSTDKAVYPINAMGISKAMMEKLMVAKSRLTKPGGTILCGTRYGNVMASRGSVIPLFIQQVREGNPLTVTDPMMTRFMLSIDDAVDLVLYAYKHGRPGDIFVRKAPAATMETLALAVRQIFGAPNPVKIIGTRHGEKLFETLLTREEKVKANDLGDYLRVPADNRDLNYSVYFTHGQETLSHEDDYTSHNTERLDVTGMTEMLLKLEFVQQELKHWRRGEETRTQAEHSVPPPAPAGSPIVPGNRRAHRRGGSCR